MERTGMSYNPERSRGNYAREISWSQMSGGRTPSHTESFYRSLRDVAEREEKHSHNACEQEEKKCVKRGDGNGNILSAQGLFGGLDSLGGSLGSGLSSLLKRIGEDDILIILMIILLLNENRKDDYLVLIILGVILLT